METDADLVIAGAGIFGLTIAERAAKAGYKVLILEMLDTIGGNMATYTDPKTGIEVHKYGSHIFHTNNQRVWQYVNQFTPFIPYKHRVRTTTADNRVIPLPFTLATFSTYYNQAFTPETIKTLVASFPQNDTNFEDVAISSVGPELYEAIIKGYTTKQWGIDPKQLPASTIKRLPVRHNWDDGYFTDQFQGIPEDGYQTWMTRMAFHPNIEIRYNTNALDYEITKPYIFTGPIDSYFKHKHGHLNYRAIKLIEQHLDTDDFQGCPVMNYADENVPYTRIHEYKHYRPDKKTSGTIIHYEYSYKPEPGEIAAYPVNTAEDRETLNLYRQEAKQLDAVWFGGRLGSYQYLDMHAAIASALTLWDNEVQPYLERKK